MTFRNNGTRRSSAAKPRPLLLLFLLLALFPALSAMALRPDEIPSPNIASRENFVADPYDMLSNNSERHVNEILSRLREETTCEVGVAIVKTTGDLSIEDYAYKLFHHWGIGRADNNNGILLLIATDDNRARIEVGSGAEGAMPDITAGNILRKAVVPAMKDGNLNQAVAGAVDMINDVLTEPSVAEELRSDHNPGFADNIKAIDGKVIWSFLWVVALCVFVFTLAMFFIDFFTTRKRDNYRRAMTWRSHLKTYWWGALFSCGLALPIALIVWRLYRHSRDVTEICDSCGAKMKKLSEDEDNAFLSAAQDFEEKLGTVDYDVWLCPECGTVERFPYVEHQLKYRQCPECGTIAMNLVMDKVVDPPTTTRPGHGERIYQCQFCRHKRREGYVIPKKDDGAALAVAAGVAAGMLGGGHSGGGGGMGGGFGGGHSSGGGASSGW